MHHLYAWYPRDQKRVSGSLDLELQRAVSHQVVHGMESVLLITEPPLKTPYPLLSM